MFDHLDLESKTVVITGASRGLGAGMAEEMHRLGLRLGLCARSAPVLGEGERVLSRRLDVTDGEAVLWFRDEVLDRFGAIDLWINNAGVLEPIDQVRLVTSTAFRQHLEINVLGVFNGARAYADYVHGSEHTGVLVNISSGAGRYAYSGWSAYCASKAAVDRLTEVLAMEESEHGLRAHAVAPGIIDTEMQELIRGSSPEQFPEVETFRQLPELGAFTTVEDVAHKMLSLAFDPDQTPREVLVDLRE